MKCHDEGHSKNTAKVAYDCIEIDTGNRPIVGFMLLGSSEPSVKRQKRCL